MTKRGRKPGIDPKQGREWLRRCELGESPQRIAKTDSFDLRTVRKHIEMAKQEMEVKEARSMVLRNALEEHYRDLCNHAEKLSALKSGETAAWLPREAYIHNALRQHLPRSPIWGYLNRREILNEQIRHLRHQVALKVEEVVKSNTQLSSELGSSESEAVPGIIAALKCQVEEWIQGQPGLNIKEHFIVDDAGDGSANLRYGFEMRRVKTEHIALIRGVLQDSESSIKQWEEYKRLAASLIELRRVEVNLREELAVITLRRIVPGRCHYCPL